MGFWHDMLSGSLKMGALGMGAGFGASIGANFFAQAMCHGQQCCPNFMNAMSGKQQRNFLRLERDQVGAYKHYLDRSIDMAGSKQERNALRFQRDQATAFQKYLSRTIDATC
jgi:hypothetical protein